MPGRALHGAVLALDVPLVAGLDHRGLYRPALEIGKDLERSGTIRVEGSVPKGLGEGRRRRALRRHDPLRLKARARLLPILPAAMQPPEFVRRERPEPCRVGKEALVGVVLAKEEAVFGARREHAVRLLGPFYD